MQDTEEKLDMKTAKEREELRDLLLRLCAVPGNSGDELSASKAAAAELAALGETEIDSVGNVYMHFGKKDAKEHILLDAHIDQIGLIVTGIDGDGFLTVDSCGGMDKRLLPGSAVTVYGKEKLTGIVCCMPPHLMKGEEKLVPVNELHVDVGLSQEEAKKLVSPGDRALMWMKPKMLLNGRVSTGALDDRAGCAALIRCAQILKDEKLSCRVTVLLSCDEEVNSRGARTGGFRMQPTRAIVVDVGFAAQPGVPETVSQPLGAGPTVGFAPILDGEMSRRFVSLAEENQIPFKADVCGGRTYTNSEAVAVVGSGVRTALISIPLCYMHSAIETVDLEDVENTARLIAAYIKEVGARG